MGKTHVLIASVTLKLFKERHVGFCILPVREILGIAIARPGPGIALKLDAIYAKILEIKRVSLVANREIGFAL